MSRLPRSQEHLKTAFIAEAASAARFRAYAAHAEAEEMPSLANEWRRLAGDKDRLAGELLAAAGQAPDPGGAVREALAEERYENDVLYPKMIREVDEEAARVLSSVVEDQARHLERLGRLRRAVQSASGDIEPMAPVEEYAGRRDVMTPERAATMILEDGTRVVEGLDSRWELSFGHDAHDRRVWLDAQAVHQFVETAEQVNNRHQFENRLVVQA